MTKLEALAKDCIENHTHRLIDRPSKQDIYTREESIYISGYKECERQNKNKIKELEAQLKAEHTKGELDFVKINCNSSCKKIAELEQKLEQTEKDLADYQFNYPTIKDLEKENAELKKYSDNLSLKDEELMCLETEFNTYKSEVKEIIKFLINPQLLDKPQYYEWRLKAEQFLKEE